MESTSPPLDPKRAYELAKEISRIEGVIGVEFVARDGEVLARANTGLDIGPEWLKSDGALPSVVWGIITKAEALFGRAEVVVVDFEKARLCGFMVGREGLACVVATNPRAEPHSLEAAVEALV